MLWNLKDALSDALVRAVRAPGSAHRVEVPDARQGRMGRVGRLDSGSTLFAPFAHDSSVLIPASSSEELTAFGDDAVCHLDCILW